MSGLRNFTVNELITELQNREEIRSMDIGKNEVHKVQAMGNDNSKDRYIKGEGPAIILEVKRR